MTSSSLIESTVYAIVKLKAPKLQQSFKTIRSFKSYNPMEFRSDLYRQHNTLDLILQHTDVNDEVFVFDKLLMSTLEKHAPLVTVRIKAPFTLRTIFGTVREKWYG